MDGGKNVIHNQKVYFLALALIFMLFGTKVAPTPEKISEKICNDCSCYTFHTVIKAWNDANKNCTANNGRLVVMETEKEWRFINSQIQNITVGYGDSDNEWFIGLTGKTKTKTREWKNVGGKEEIAEEKRKGWTWVNGEKLTIDKWQPREPSGGEALQNNKHCVLMAKNWPTDTYGLFNDLKCTAEKPFICEYVREAECTTVGPKTTASSSQFPIKETSKIVKTTTSIQTTPKAATEFINPITIATNKPTPTSKYKRTVSNNHSTSPSLGHGSLPTDSKRVQVVSTPSPETFTSTQQSGERQSSKSGFEIVPIIIIICVLFVVGFCLLMTVCFWKKKKKEKRQNSLDNTEKGKEPLPAGINTTNEIPRGSSFVAFTMVHNNLTHPKPSLEEPAYDTVADENNKTATMETPLTTDSKDIHPKLEVSNANEQNAIAGTTLTSSNGEAKPEVLYASVQKSKKKSDGSKNSKRKSKAKMEETSSNKGDDKEAVYEEVKKVDKDKSQNSNPPQQPQIMYADLAEFNNNGETPPVKPDPYQPVEYAVIVGKKAAK